MTIVPFSSEHLGLLDALPEETGPRRQTAGLFVEIGHPRLVCVARLAARRRRGWRQPLEVADALSLAHIYVRILEGRYSALPGDTLKRDRIEADIDNCVRSHVRRELRHRKQPSRPGRLRRIRRGNNLSKMYMRIDLGEFY